LCAVLDALVIALYVTIDELVGLAEAGLPAQRKSTGDQLRSEVLAEVANSSSDRARTVPPR
jgi:hypothetical protein